MLTELKAFRKKEYILVGYVLPTAVARRNMGPGSQTGSDIIQRRSLSSVDRKPHVCENSTFRQTYVFSVITYNLLT